MRIHSAFIWCVICDACEICLGCLHYCIALLQTTHRDSMHDLVNLFRINPPVVNGDFFNKNCENEICFCWLWNKWRRIQIDRRRIGLKIKVVYICEQQAADLLITYILNWSSRCAIKVDALRFAGTWTILTW